MSNKIILSDKGIAKVLRSAASAIEHGRRTTFYKKLAMLFTIEEQDALVALTERALDDIDNYVLSGNGERDYGAEFGDVVEQNAKYFDAMTSLCAKIGLPGHFDTVATRLRQYAVEWNERSEEEKKYGSQLSDENSVR